MSFNYIGSKKKLIDFLDNVVNKIVSTYKDKTNIKFFDGFAGTGIVGSSFHKKYNFITISNDLEYYSYIINYSLLCVSYSKKLETLIKEINNDLNDDNNKVIKNYDLITMNYSPKGKDKRKFWTDTNAIRCDYIRFIIDTKLEKNVITEDEHIYLIGSLLASMDSVANTACVYGAFLKQFKKTANEKLVLKPIHINDNLNSNNKVYNVDINSDTIYNEEFDICYLDPPYNNRQYSANYHPLNYIALYDKNLEIYGKTGLIKNYNKSKYCNKLSAIKMLELLVSNIKTKHILLSYNNEGIMNFEEIKKVLMSKGKVILYKKEYKKFKSNNNQSSVGVNEYLFHCEQSDDKTFTEIII